MSLREKGQDFRDLYESMSARDEERAPRLAMLIHEGLREEKPKFVDTDFSIREIWEAVDPSSFTIITGELVSKRFMDAFTAGTKVGDALTTAFVSTQETDNVPGVYNLGTMEDVNPGQPYPELGDVKEKYVTMAHAKRGLILAITEEAIKFDQTGLVLKKAGDFGEILAHDREKKIINTILDLAGYKAYRPAGVQTDLFGGGYLNMITNALENWTDIDAAKVLLGNITDENGDPINVTAGGELAMLVPTALGTQSARLRGSIMPGAANQEDNPFANAYAPYESSYLDLQSATAWLYGNFKKQYSLKVVIPPQVLRMKADSYDAWKRDIVSAFKIRYDATPGALDWRYVIYSDGTVS